MLLFVGIFIGVVIGLVISTNFDMVMKSVAADYRSSTIALGSSEPVAQELLGLQSLSKAFVAVAKQVNPAVVTINSSKTVKQRFTHPFMNDPFFRQFFQMPEQRDLVMRGLGSGVIVNPDGYILTNNHVIADMDEITVSIDRKEYDAKVIGKDPASDVAVIKIDKKNLPTIKLGDSDDLEVGEWVLAVGSPFSDILEKTVTAGIVSAKGRSLGNQLGNGSLKFQDFIQTDAAINPGNSGGAMVNLRGELVGINTAIVGQANVGVGFAIPINLAKSVMEQLIKTGKVRRGWLGVQIGDVDEEMAESNGLDGPKGAYVQSVVKGGPADKAGIKADDIILKFEGVDIKSRDQLTAIIASYAPDKQVDVSVWRDGATKVVPVSLGERPAEDQLAETVDQGAKAEKLGIGVQDLTSQLAEEYNLGDEQGVLIVDIEANSVAERKGLQRGDLIQSVNGQTVTKVRDFTAALRKVEAAAVVKLRIVRENMTFTVYLRMPKE